MDHTQHIVCDATRPPIRIARENVYFAFSSGRFTYDCASCGAKCCRGHGYDMRMGPEVRSQLSFRPAVRFFVEASHGGGPNYHVKNCAPSCFFLTEAGLCDIHARHGMSAKPETCRLFPFNSFVRVGEYLVVNPHPSLCPLSVSADETHDTASDHDHLFAAMSDQPIGGLIGQATPIAADSARAVELERRIVRLSEDHLRDDSYESFGAAQVIAACGLGVCSKGQHRCREEKDVRTDVEGFLARLREVLGLGRQVSPVPDPVLTRTLVAMSPCLRSRLVFPRAESLKECQCALGLEQVPNVLLVLQTLLQLARDAGMHEITYQSVAGVFDNSQQLLRLLAHLDRVVVWRAGEMIDVRWGRATRYLEPYVRLVKTLLPGVQRERRWPLWRVLCEHLPQQELDRAMFLRMVARQIVNHLVPIDDFAIVADRRTPIRSAVQHWALRHVSAETVLRVTGRGGDDAFDGLPSPSGR
jgi:Fe-S-cluster containining protein